MCIFIIAQITSDNFGDTGNDFGVVEMNHECSPQQLGNSRKNRVGNRDTKEVPPWASQLLVQTKLEF